MTVLAVDDEATVLKLLGSVLSREGYRVLLAEDGARALSFLSSHPEIDVVVTDVRMPGLSGIELADAIGDIRPDLPVIFITGHPGDYLDRLHGRAVVTKPFHPAKLLATIQAAVGEAGAKTPPAG